MGEQAEQGVGGEAPLLLQQHDDHGKSGAYREDADGQVDRQQEAERDAQQRRMRQRIAEIGHAPPHHETAQRAGHQGDPDAADNGANHKVIEKHRCLSQSPLSRALKSAVGHPRPSSFDRFSG